MSRAPVLLFVCVLLVYNLNLQRIASGDTVPASVLPLSVLLDRSVTLDRFYPWFREYAPQHLRAFTVRDGRVYSSYPIALPLLVTPLYAPAALLVHGRGLDLNSTVVLAGVMEKIAASLVAAISVVFFFFLARRLVSERRAVLLAILFAFGTETWTISSQALWTHGASELAVIGGIFFLARCAEESRRRAPIVLAGLFGALGVAIRPTNMLFLLAMYAWLLLARRRFAVIGLFSVFPVIVGGAVGAYNFHVFGRLSGMYGAWFDASFWNGLAGVLVSPSRGLFIYTPVFLFSVLGAAVWLKKRQPLEPPIYFVSLLFVGTQVLLVSKWSMWWGGHCYGPRLLTDIVPCLVLLVAPAMDTVSRTGLLRLLFGLTFGVSIAVQAVGAFCYPNSNWDEKPMTLGERPERLWDWADNPISRGIATGPRIGPDPRTYPALRQIL